MFLLFIVVLILGIIFVIKTKKIKDIHNKLIRKESMFYELYDQKFNAFLKMMHATDVNIQNSIFMNIGELRRKSIFLKEENNTKGFVLLGDKINKLLINSIEENLFNEKETIFIENNEVIEKLNLIIEETKNDYNNLVDHYNQEKGDFFGKNVFKLMKNLKKFPNL